MGRIASTTNCITAAVQTQPKYSVRVARVSNLQADGDCDSKADLKLPVPQFSQLCQLIEVRKCGSAFPRQIDHRLNQTGFLSTHIIINNCRPELFLRRDFIKQFVLTGQVCLAQLSGGYHLTAKNNVLLITLNAKQYRRFGLIAKRVLKSKNDTNEVLYRCEVDLKDEKIRTCNKFQDKLTDMLRRLDPIEKIYFKFVPNEATKSTIEVDSLNLSNWSLKFFNHVIKEYALDGCQPVPLTGCSLVSQRIQKSWLNCSQLHPSFNLSSVLQNNALFDEGAKCESYWTDMATVTDIVDWLGYQLLSLDCDREAIRSAWTSTDDDGDCSRASRVDVSCVQISGVFDAQHVEENLLEVFDTQELDDLLLRALILYEEAPPATLYKQIGANLAEGGADDDVAFDDELDTRGQRLSSLCRRGDEGISDGKTSPSLSSSSFSNNACGFYQSGANNGSSGVVLLQDCSRGPRAAKGITIIGMSTLAN